MYIKLSRVTQRSRSRTAENSGNKKRVRRTVPKTITLTIQVRRVAVEQMAQSILKRGGVLLANVIIGQSRKGELYALTTHEKLFTLKK